MKTYENKELWATAFFREKFFDRIRTMSQCEGINSLINAYIRKKNSLLEFIQNLELALREYRNNELVADFYSFYSDPKMTTSLHKLEVCVAKNFTREIFIEVKTHIEQAGALNVIERIEDEDKFVYRMNKFGNPEEEYQVMYDSGNCKFLFDCRLFESRGKGC